MWHKAGSRENPLRNYSPWDFKHLFKIVCAVTFWYYHILPNRILLNLIHWSSGVILPFGNARNHKEQDINRRLTSIPRWFHVLPKEILHVMNKILAWTLWMHQSHRKEIHSFFSVEWITPCENFCPCTVRFSSQGRKTGSEDF